MVVYLYSMRRQTLIDMHQLVYRMCDTYCHAHQTSFDIVMYDWLKNADHLLNNIVKVKVMCGITVFCYRFLQYSETQQQRVKDELASN